MSDNVDFYKKFIFQLPSTEVLAGITALLGIVLGITSFFLFAAFASPPNILFIVGAPFLFFVLPAVISAELMAVIGRVQRNWAYVISIIDEITVFLFAGLILFTTTLGEAWQVLWLGLATIYLLNLLLISLVRTKRKYPLNLALPLAFPLSLLVFFHITVGRTIGISRDLYLQNIMLFFASGFLLLLTMGLYQFIIDANVQENFSVYDFFGTILTGDEQYIPGSMEVNVPHQALRIEQSDDSLTYNIPWLHPGPVAGFGGGRLTSELIDAPEDFVLHIPSYHTLDLCDPDDIDRFQEPPAVETTTEATRMYRVERDSFTLRGRRYGDRTVIYIENRTVDDYDPSIAYGIKEQYPDLAVIDLHNQPIEGDHTRIQSLDNQLDALKQGIEDLYQQLQDAEQHRYHAGFAGTDDHMCLIEAVDGQRTCLITVDGNDAPSVLYDIEDDLDYDHTLISTTDSHQHLVELARPQEIEREDITASVDEAESCLSEASAGIGEKTVEDVEVMGNNYEGLIFTLNIMARLVPISLLLYYIGIVFLTL